MNKTLLLSKGIPVYVETLKRKGALSDLSAVVNNIAI